MTNDGPLRDSDTGALTVRFARGFDADGAERVGTSGASECGRGSSLCGVYLRRSNIRQRIFRPSLVCFRCPCSKTPPNRTCKCSCITEQKNQQLAFGSVGQFDYMGFSNADIQATPNRLLLPPGKLLRRAQCCAARATLENSAHSREYTEASDEHPLKFRRLVGPVTPKEMGQRSQSDLYICTHYIICWSFPRGAD